MWEKVGDRTFSGSPWDSRQPSLQERGGGSGDWAFWQRAADQRENQPRTSASSLMYLATLPWVKLQDPATFYHRPSSLLHCTDMLLLFLLQDVAHLCEKAQNLATWPEREVVGSFRSCDRWFLSVHSREKIELHVVWNSWSCRPDEAEKPSSWTDITLKTGRAATSLNYKDDLRPLLHSETKISSGRRRSSPTEMPLPMRKEWRSSQTTCTKVAYCGPINQCLFVDNNQTDFPSDEGF